MGEKITKEHLSEHYSCPAEKFLVECIIPFVIDNKSVLLLGDYEKIQRTGSSEEFDDEIMIDGGAGIENLDLKKIWRDYKLDKTTSGILTIGATSSTFMPSVFKIDSEMLQKVDCSSTKEENYASDLFLTFESNFSYVEFCKDCPTRSSVLETLDHYLYKYPQNSKNLNYRRKFIVAREYFIRTLPDAYLDLPLNSLDLSLPTSQALAENNLCLVKDVLALNDEKLRNLKSFSEESFEEWKKKIIGLILLTEPESEKDS